MNKTLLFYDLETSGLNHSFDQVMQYAAIRTDLSGKELSRDTYLVQLSPDVIPNPQALLIHGQGIQTCNQEGCNQEEAVFSIHQALNQPGTCSGGYNTLGFDDEFMRFSFYRYLLPPYTHQYANACSRFDCYPMTVLYYLFKPEALTWPEKEGKPSFKLSELNAANNLVEGARAHDALSDVEVTLALAKRLQKYPKMWEYAFGYFNKREDLARQAKFPKQFEQYALDYPLALWVEGSLGAAMCYQAPVLGLGTHRHYKNQTLWLRLDDLTLLETTEDSLLDHPRILRKKAGEPGFLLPLLPRYTHHFTTERRERVHAVLAWCQENPKLIKQIGSLHADQTYDPVVCDVDAALYAGFRSDKENDQAHFFRSAPPEKRAELVFTFSKIMQEQALRILWRHHSHVLTAQHLTLLEPFITGLQSGGVLDYRGQSKSTPDEIRKDIEQLRQTSLSAVENNLLDELEQYLDTEYCVQAY